MHIPDLPFPNHSQVQHTTYTRPARVPQIHHTWIRRINHTPSQDHSEQLRQDVFVYQQVQHHLQEHLQGLVFQVLYGGQEDDHPLCRWRLQQVHVLPSQARLPELGVAEWGRVWQVHRKFLPPWPWLGQMLTVNFDRRRGARLVARVCPARMTAERAYPRF